MQAENRFRRNGGIGAGPRSMSTGPTPRTGPISLMSDFKQAASVVMVVQRGGTSCWMMSRSIAKETL